MFKWWESDHHRIRDKCVSQYLHAHHYTVAYMWMSSLCAYGLWNSAENSWEQRGPLLWECGVHSAPHHTDMLAHH